MSDDQNSNPFASPQADEISGRGPRSADGRTMEEMPTVAPCPECGAPDSTPAPYNWWRGRRAPTALGHVVCPKCDCEFNGETGKAYPPAMNPLPFFIVALVLFVLYFVAYIAFHVFLFTR